MSVNTKEGLFVNSVGENIERMQIISAFSFFKYLWLGCQNLTIILRKKDNKEKDIDNNTDNTFAYYIAFGILIGTSLGVVFGMLFDNVGLGVSFGTSFGLVLGTAVGASKMNESDETDDEEN